MLAPWPAGARRTTGDREPTAAPLALSVMVSGEEGQIVPRGVVRGEVGGDEQDAGCGWEQRGEGGGGGGGGGGRGALQLVVLACHDAWVQQRLILEVHARGDKELREVLGAEVAVADGQGEASPEGVAGKLEGG